MHTADIGAYSSWTDETGYFLYGQEADSTFDISFDPGEPGLSSNGHVEISNSLDNAFTQDYSGKVANFTLSVFDGSKSQTKAPEPDHYCSNPQWLVEPISWQGGIGDGAALPASENKSGTCATSIGTTNNLWLDANAKWTRSSYQAATVASGFTIFGSSLSIQSGYSTTVVMFWHTGTEYKNHWLCSGGDGDPSQSPLVFAGPNTD